MSYILDALKKAERERGLTQAPTLMTVHDFRGMRRHRKAAITGGLLVCSAAVLWFFQPALRKIIRPPAPSLASAEPNRIANRPEVERVGESTPVSAAPSPFPSPEPPTPLNAGRSQGSAMPGSGEVRLGRREEIAPNSAVPRKSLEDGHGSSQSTQGLTSPQQIGSAPLSPPSVQPARPPSVSTDVPAPKEVKPASGAAQAMPASLREAVAKMTLSILVYNDDEAARKAYINGRRYVTGELVDGLYLIESITLEGVVLSYGGERAVLRPR